MNQFLINEIERIEKACQEGILEDKLKAQAMDYVNKLKTTLQFLDTDGT